MPHGGARHLPWQRKPHPGSASPCSWANGLPSSPLGFLNEGDGRAASRAVARIKQKRKCKRRAVMPRGQPALRGQKLPLVQERGLRWHGGCRGRRTPGKLSPWCRHHVTQFSMEQRLTFCFALKQNFGKTVLLLLSWRSYNWKEVCVWWGEVLWGVSRHFGDFLSSLYVHGTKS